jgi:hypothetical protein
VKQAEIHDFQNLPAAQQLVSRRQLAELVEMREV